LLTQLSIVSGAVAGAGFYLYRLSQGPEVTWNRHGDWRPWDKIKQDQNVS
jgi:NADH dehydrogenase (ubiquinone) 1 alpha subcomplex subunit 4